MSAIASIYADSLHNHFRPFFATWQPGTPLRLGDYGTITNNIFTRLGNIQEEGVRFDEIEDPTEDQYEFTSSSGTEFVFTAGGSGGGSALSVKAGLDIRFESANSVFFNAAGCRISSINNIRALGEELIQRDKNGTWNRQLAVVTSLVSAGATTIIISGSNNASISLEAKTEGVDTIDLADANLALRLKSQKNVAFKVITSQGLSPLFGVMQVKRDRDLFGRMGPHRFEPTRSIPANEEEGDGEESLIFTVG